MNQGKILICIGLVHSLFGATPFAFGQQFSDFSKKLFFRISEGPSEFPLLGGQMNFENFSAFWFFYFGLLLIPLGILVMHLEKISVPLPQSFLWTYLVIVGLGVYMIPFSGMTFVMLPHALYILINNKKTPLIISKFKQHEN